ncbi:type II toxin-antitoxin system RelE/ParE family toxin [Methylorubrum thiocyanatum]
MAHDLVFHRLARADLFEIYDYIEERSGAARAGGFLDRIEAACRGLTEFPGKARRAMMFPPVCEPGRWSAGS